MLISLFDAYIVIPPSNIEFWEDVGAAKICYEFWNQREGVLIVYSVVVNTSVVLYWP